MTTSTPNLMLGTRRRARRRTALRLYPRHRLDVRAGTLAHAVGASLFAGGADAREQALEAALDPAAVVCASVRSGFELALEALALPPGSEVLVSAITHPDMAAILVRHGLVPVPVDLDVGTLAPRADLLASSVSPRTRALVVAHLFGGRADLDAAAALAREHGLIFFEDCAQAFRGPDDRGDPRADVTMFSFGSIKTCPALGGAVLYVRCPKLLDGMRTRRAAWPRQRRADYLRRVLRFCGLHALENPWLYGALVRLGRLGGLDVDRVVNRTVHALRPPASGRERAFEAWLRRRPSAPLLAVLARRLRTFDAGRLARRAARGDELACRLPSGLFHPGSAALEHTHWVFPVVAADPAALVASLRGAGFDATTRTTSIAALPAAGRGQAPVDATRLMDGVVFVPAYPELPRRAFEALVDALCETAAEERA